jgi:hypothetical protein
LKSFQLQSCSLQQDLSNVVSHIFIRGHLTLVLQYQWLEIKLLNWLLVSFFTIILVNVFKWIMWAHFQCLCFWKNFNNIKKFDGVTKKSPQQHYKKLPIWIEFAFENLFKKFRTLQNPFSLRQFSPTIGPLGWKGKSYPLHYMFFL